MACRPRPWPGGAAAWGCTTVAIFMALLMTSISMAQASTIDGYGGIYNDIGVRIGLTRVKDSLI